MGIGLVWCAVAALMAGPAELAVRVYDYAPVKAKVRLEMERELRRILGDAGIHVKLRDCRGDASRECTTLAERGVIELRIVRRVDGSARGKQRGFAAMTREGGTMISVIAGKLRVEERQFHMNEGVLLGHIAAHEIGHILLGPESHATHGIMESCWTAQSLEKINQGALLFSDQEGERMRAEVAGN